MSITAFNEKVAAATQVIWTERPRDIERMVDRNLATDKEFSCWAYCWGYASNLSDYLYLVFGLARDGKGELGAQALLVAEQCRGFADGLRVSEHMEDTAGLLEEAADVVGEARDLDELAEFCRVLQLYVAQLSFWVDIELPWAEVSALVDASWKSAEARAGRV